MRYGPQRLCAFKAFSCFILSPPPPVFLSKKKAQSFRWEGVLFLPPWPLRPPPPTAPISLHNYILHLFFHPVRAMNDHQGGEYHPFCDFHPNELVVGVCAHCLKERLLVLASKQRQPSPPKMSKRSFRVAKRKHLIKLPKVFALGPFLYRLDSRRRRDDENEVDDSNEGGSIASNEDSFISVQFDDDGQASWDNKEAMSTGSSTSSNNGGNEAGRNNNRTMVEKTKKKGLKWKKRIRQLLRLERSKMSTDRGNRLVGFGGAKGRKSWVIGSLTRRRYSSV